MALMLILLSLAVGLGTMVSISEQRPVYETQLQEDVPVELTARNWGNNGGGGGNFNGGNMYGRQNTFGGGGNRFQNIDPYQQAYKQGRWAAKMKHLQRKQARLNGGGGFNRFNGGNSFNGGQGFNNYNQGQNGDWD